MHEFVWGGWSGRRDHRRLASGPKEGAGLWPPGKGTALATTHPGSPFQPGPEGPGGVGSGGKGCWAVRA